MALNKSFRVKDSLYVGTSGFFAGSVSIDTTGKILSGGRDLADLFKCNSAALTQGNCITNFSYDGTSAATVSICPAAYNSWDYAGTNITNAVSAIACTSQGGFTYDKVGTAPFSIVDVGLSTTSTPTFAGLTLNGEIDMTADKIVNVADPTSAQDAATKAYVDATGAGTVCSVTAGNDTITIGGTAANPTVRVADACDTKWDSVYTSYRGVSAVIVCNVSSSGVQGNLSETQLGSAAAAIDLGLCTGDSPTFAGVTADSVRVGITAANEIDTSSDNLILDSAGGTVQVDDNLCVTGGITFDGTATGDGSGLTGVTATACFPSTACTSIKAADKFFINDGVNKHICYLNLLTDLAGGTRLVVTGSDSLCVAGADSLSPNTLSKWTGSAFTDSLASSTATTLTIGGDHLVTGDSTIYGNLSVTGDFTCIETTVSTTSALSVTNTGTGPALFVKQGGTQPIAHFIDSNGGDIIFADDGKVGIGTFTPSAPLHIADSSDAEILVDNTSGFTGDLSTITIKSFGSEWALTNNRAGNGKFSIRDVTDNRHVIVLDGDGDVGIGTSSPSEKLDVAGNITASGNLTIGDGGKIKLPATGGSIYAEEQTFTASVGTGGTTVATFAKSGFRTGKYIVSLIKGVNRTSFEILVTYNDTASFGTVYGIVDAQAASQLASVDVTNTGSTIDLVITSASATTTAIVHGKAFY